MHRTLTLLTYPLTFALSAQSPTTPAIGTNDPVLSNGRTVELHTPPYDTYHWYHEGQAITEAHGRTVVDDGIEGGTPTSIEVKKDGPMARDAAVIASTSASPPVVITEVNGTLCALPEGVIHQWYLAGVALLNTNSPCIRPTAPGAYTVRAYDAQDRLSTSSPYLFMDSNSEGSERPWQAHAKDDRLVVTWPGDVPEDAFWAVLDDQGHSVQYGRMPNDEPLVVDLAQFPAGVYLFQASQQRKATAPATRFTVVH